jgi:hypothetical protein
MAIALLTLALVGTASLCFSMFVGYQVHAQAALMKQHFLWSLLSTAALVMAHSFIMFFLIATGVEMKDMEKEKGWGDTFRRRTIALKGRVFPAMTFALLLVMANFILGAAAHTHAIPAWVHALLAWSTLVLCLFTLYREYEVLGENNRLIAEAGERRRKSPAVTAPQA